MPTGNLVTKSSSKYKMDLLSLDWVHHGAAADNFVCVLSFDFILSLHLSLPPSILSFLSLFLPPLFSLSFSLLSLYNIADVRIW